MAGGRGYRHEIWRDMSIYSELISGNGRHKRDPAGLDEITRDNSKISRWETRISDNVMSI